MTLPVRVSVRGLCALLWMAVALTGPGCRRMVKPEPGGDRTVEAGVPVAFGSEAADAAEVLWDFGDGTPPQRGQRLEHAFPRSGTFTVRALEKEEVLASARLTVVPRAVLRAIPEDVEAVVFFPQMRGNVQPMLDFASRLLGEEQARQALSALPLLSTVLIEVRGEGQLVDPEEGAGFYSVAGFDGVVGLIGVMDGPAALDEVVKELESNGVHVSRRDATGALLQQGGLPMAVFLDRGYLYLVAPDAPDAPAAPGTESAEGTGGSPPPAPVTPEAVEALRARVTGFQGPGLSELPLLTGMRSKVGEGNAYFFARPTSGTENIQGFWGALSFEPARAGMEGWIAWDKSLFTGAGAPAPAGLGQAPAGPIAALTVSIPPTELATLAFGAPGSERRLKTLSNLMEQGLDVSEAEGLVGALRGDLSLLAYFDAPAFYRNFIQGSRKPEPRGMLLFQAGLVRSAPVLEWILGRLKAGEHPHKVKKEGATTRVTTQALGQPVELVVTADGLTMRGGESLAARTQGDVGAGLRERFQAEAFSSGHLSLGLDVGRLRKELDAPEVPGVPAQQLPMARALVGTVMEQLPPVDTLFLDFAPEQDGGRLRLRASLRGP